MSSIFNYEYRLTLSTVQEAIVTRTRQLSLLTSKFSLDKFKWIKFNPLFEIKEFLFSYLILIMDSINLIPFCLNYNLISFSNY